MFTPMVELIPEAKLGEAEVVHFEITEEQARFARMRAAIGHSRERVLPGRYAQLRVRNQLVMSDTGHEQQTNRELVRRSHGKILIGGLGLGMVLVPILKKAEVDHVTVIEKSADVISLVGACFDSPKLEIIEADILEWKPPRGTRYDAIYFDIWPNICADNYEEMKKLHRRFGRYKTEGGWMSSWEHASTRDLRRYGWRHQCW